MTTKTKLAKVWPSSFELLGLLPLSILVVLLGNSQQFLEYYGLASSNQVLQRSAGGAVTQALSKLDRLGATSEIVTFLIWAVVGAFCFSVVRGIIDVYQSLQYEKKLSSNKYVHPTNFERKKFWSQLFTGFMVLLVAVALVGLAIMSLLLFAFPASLAYSRVFLAGTTLVSIGEVLIGLAIMYVWVVVMDICVRAVIFHRQLAA